LNTVSLIVYPAPDVAKSRQFFSTLLATEPYVDSPYYVGFKAGDMEIGLDPHAMQRGLSGALAYVDVSDIKSALASLLDAGAEKVQDVTDVAAGLLIAIVKDPSGTIVGLRQSPNA
jgi:predicted enzyme related to lactoylglutathione lyase